jgi:hypothetical protein
VAKIAELTLQQLVDRRKNPWIRRGADKDCRNVETWMQMVLISMGFSNDPFFILP